MEPVTLTAILGGVFGLGGATVKAASLVASKRREAERDEVVASKSQSVEIHKAQISQISELTRQVAMLFSHVNNQHAQLGELRTKLDTKDTQIDDLQAQVHGLQHERDELRIELAQTKTELMGSLHSAALLQGQVDKLQLRVEQGK